MCKYASLCPFYNESAVNCAKETGYEDLDCVTALFKAYNNLRDQLACQYRNNLQQQISNAYIDQSLMFQSLQLRQHAVETF